MDNIRFETNEINYNEDEISSNKYFSVFFNDYAVSNILFN